MKRLQLTVEEFYHFKVLAEHVMYSHYVSGSYVIVTANGEDLKALGYSSIEMIEECVEV